MERKTALLKIISVIFIIFGAFSVISALIILLGGTAVSGLVTWFGGPVAGVGTAALFIIIMIISCFNGLLEFIAGIMGLRAAADVRKVGACKVIATIILILAVIHFILSLVNDSSLWSALGSIILPVLYFIGANRAGEPV